MFNIPGGLPMPDKKQGLFHDCLSTFQRLPEPELQTPAIEAPAHA
jgi:hypothetical protein